jgi:Recombination endonuclease VII
MAPIDDTPSPAEVNSIELTPKEKQKAQQKAYYEANKEKIKARARAHHHANRDAILAKNKAFRDANPELVRARKKAARDANPEIYRAQKKAHRDANREQYLAREQAKRDAKTEEEKARTAEYMKAYREAKGEELLEKKRGYHRENTDEISAKKRAERRSNPAILDRERAYTKANHERIANQRRVRAAANLEKRRSDRAERMDEFREKWAKYKYGIDAAELLAMRSRQNDLCATCGTAFALSKPHIDHCHKSNAVRGLLCGLCNRSLGLMRDDPVIVRSIIRYLKHHRDEAVQSSATLHPGNSTQAYFAAVDRFRKTQDGRCAICSDEFGDKRPHLDHCHKTGLLRSLLCHRCNMALGQINDNIDIAKNIIRYLKQHSAA